MIIANKLGFTDTWKKLVERVESIQVVCSSTKPIYLVPYCQNKRCDSGGDAAQYCCVAAWCGLLLPTIFSRFLVSLFMLHST